MQVEDLLRFKRHEEPGQEFWEGFDSGLESRRLQTLLETEPVRRRTRSWRWIAGLSTVSGLAAVFLATLGLPFTSTVIDDVLPTEAQLASASAATQAPEPTVSAPAPLERVATTLASISGAQPLFVANTLNNEQEANSFRRVFQPSSLPASRSSQQTYVTDSLAGQAQPVRVIRTSHSF